MVEQLTEAELEALMDALEDGFPDMLGRRSQSNKRSYGKVFGTNPLGEETVYFMTSEGAPLSLTAEQMERSLRTDGEIFAEADGFREFFSLNPFGGNFHKLKIYFEDRIAERKMFLEERFQRYLKKAERYPSEVLIDLPGYPDVFDGIYNYNQWLENVLVPYSKLWFEYNILRLLHTLSARTKVNSSQYGLSLDEEQRSFFVEQNLKDALLAGRMIEHYRWKFNYETAALKGLQAVKLEKDRGRKGGQASERLKRENIEAFLSEIEVLGDLFPRISEQAIFEQAYQNASAQRKMPKSRKTIEGYGIAIRSEPEYKSRYNAIFRRNA